MPNRIPHSMDVFARYRRHLGPKMEAAGVGVQFHGNQGSGIAFRVVGVSPEVRTAIQKGIEDGIVARYGAPLADCAVWITRVEEDPIESSLEALYLAARGAIDLAHSITNAPRYEPERL